MTKTPTGWPEAILGVVGVILVLTLQPLLPAWQSTLLLWLPMVAAVVIHAVRRRHHAHNRADAAAAAPGIRWRITGMDVLVGLFAGLALRAIVSGIELATTGTINGGITQRGDSQLLWIAVAILAPAVLAPIIEEAFYRGLVLSAIGLNWVGIIASAIIFAAMHLVGGWHPVTAVSTALVGLTLGYLAVKTQRIGAPIVAHITYNSTLLALIYSTGIGTTIS